MLGWWKRPPRIRSMHACAISSRPAMGRSCSSTLRMRDGVTTCSGGSAGGGGAVGSDCDCAAAAPAWSLRRCARHGRMGGKVSQRDIAAPPRTRALNARTFVRTLGCFGPVPARPLLPLLLPAAAAPPFLRLHGTWKVGGRSVGSKRGVSILSDRRIGCIHALPTDTRSGPRAPPTIVHPPLGAAASPSSRFVRHRLALAAADAAPRSPPPTQRPSRRRRRLMACARPRRCPRHAASPSPRPHAPAALRISRRHAGPVRM